MHHEASYLLTFSDSLLGQAAACQCGLCAFLQPGSAQTSPVINNHIQSGITSSKNSAPSLDVTKNHAKGFFLKGIIVPAIL